MNDFPAFKCSVYVAASVDGFIAGPNGDIDWLLRPEYSPVGMNGLTFEDFLATVDAMVMGRNTFEKVASLGDWPYQDVPVIVLTGRGVTVPAHLQDKVRVDSGPPEQIVSRLASEGKEHLYIDGGNTIQRFLKARLINEITITRIPILLGDGIPLFGPGDREQPLRLIDAISSDNGFIQERYEVLTDK